MNIRRGGIRDVVVHDAVDAAEIDSPGEQVGGDEDPDVAGAETRHDRGAEGGGEVGM